MRTSSLDKATWKNRIIALGPVLKAAQAGDWPSKDDLAKTIDKISEGLAGQLAALEKDAGFIFVTGADADDLTQKTSGLLWRWHRGGGEPSLAALTIFAAEQLGLELPHELMEGVLTAAVLGEVENTLPYHNNMHYKKVLLQLLRLAAVHNAIYEGTSRAFDDRQIALLIIAACIHDFGHDGIGNTVKGIHHPGRVERRSFAATYPYFKALGMGDASLLELKVLLLSTDVSPLADPGNYMNQMKAAYRFHFLGERKGLQTLNLDDDLAPLQKNPGLAMMSLILHEADISTSAGLSYDITKFETAIYGREIGEESARPGHVIEFLDTVCHQRMLSDAAQKLYAANMARIYALAEEDVRNGDRIFPKPEHSDFILANDGRPGDFRTIN